MRSVGGRTSIVLTLLLAGLLVTKLMDVPPSEAIKSPEIKRLAVKPLPDKASPAVPKTVVLPAPPPRVRAAKSEPAKIKSLKPTAENPPAEAEIKVSKIEPLRPTPTPVPSAEPATRLKPAAKPLVKPPVKPLAKPLAKSVAKPASQKPRASVTRPGPKAAATGRVLLRVLEHGEGPAIEIAWPAASRERAILADRLRRCYGMLLALMAPSGALYSSRSARGQPWTPNLDLYSGFVRRTAGNLPAAERRLVNNIRRRHGPKGATVHVFPRRVDALLLGGLQALIGPRYKSSTSIRAHYDLNRNALIVRNLSVDGRAISGGVDLSAAEHCRDRST
jgi:hypothetical protein